MENHIWKALYEVLSLFWTKDLLNLKCVSKNWLSLITDRNFRQLQSKKVESLAGFFHQSRPQWGNEDCDSINYIPVSGITTETEVHKDLLGFVPESVYIVDSVYGLVCCRSAYPCPVPSIYVCNHANKEFKKLEWPNPSEDSCITLVFDPFKSEIGQVTDFQVVMCRKNEPTSAIGDFYFGIYNEPSAAEDFTFDIYSSKTGKWTESSVTCPCNFKKLKKGVCVQGAIYLLSDGDQILFFDPEKKISQLIMVPRPDNPINLKPQMSIGESEGKKLQYVLISEHGLQLWVLKDLVSSEWDLALMISLDVLDSVFENQERLLHFRLAEKLANDSLTGGYPWWVEILSLKDNILLMRLGHEFCSYDFRTRTLRNLCSLEDLETKCFLSANVIPYAMSLVPLP